MVEHILRLSLQHRYLVVLLVAFCALMGIAALPRLPIDAVPDITNNQVQINTVAPAFSPLEIEKQVTFPIETSLAGIPGLEYTRSLSRNGFSQITAVFSDEIDIYFARSQINERITALRESLPQGVDPVMGSLSTGLGEIYMWTVKYRHPHGKGAKTKQGVAGWQPDGSYLTGDGEYLRSDTSRAAYLRTVQDWIIRPQLKTVPGIAGIDTIGGYVKQYHVEPDAQKLVALGLSFSDVADALERNNTSVGAGTIEKAGQAYVVRADGRIETAAHIGNIVIANRHGTPIYLRDIASVVIGKELRTGSASQNGEEVVIGTALMQIGGNSRLVAEAVDTKLEAVKASLPSDITAKTVLNRMTLVDRTIATVKANLIEGALLVIAILFLLLGNFRAALISALIIPLAMLMTALGMIQSGISGNLMSLGALDFGLIVDGAVIITENCLRRLATRQHTEQRRLSLSERLEEVMIASREMIQPTVFGQAIIIMVYIPLLSFTGVEGKMFEPMALTVIFALIAAFLLSLTFVPAMLAICLTGDIVEKESRMIEKARHYYRPWLGYALRYPLRITGCALAAVSAALLLFLTMGQEFIPTLDEKDIAMHAMRIPSTALNQSQQLQFAVEKAVAEVPEVAFVFSKTGTAEMAADPMPPNVSDTFIILKDAAEWPDSDVSKQEVLAKLSAAVSAIPGNQYEFTQPIQMRFNELISGVRSDIAVKLYGDDFDVMAKTARKLEAILRGIEGAADVKMEQISGLPALQITPDKEAIARYGLNVSDVLATISVAVGGRQAGVIYQGDRHFDIVVRLPDTLRQDLTTLENLPILLPPGSAVNNMSTTAPFMEQQTPRYIPLKQLATLRSTEGLNQISRENGKRRIVVQANIRGRDIGSFVEQAQGAIAARLPLPAGYWLEWDGQFRHLEKAKSTLSVVVPLCFFMIFLLLFTALGFVRQALLVFSGVPLALTGGILALWLRGMPFSISAAVGFIALSGVAVLNGLVLVTRMNQLIREGMGPQEATITGALSRLRPVLMTALVASLGFLPMALASGAGAEVQKPLATVVIGGLISATFLTLLVLPALYRRLYPAEYG